MGEVVDFSLSTTTWSAAKEICSNWDKTAEQTTGSEGSKSGGRTCALMFALYLINKKKQESDYKLLMTYLEKRLHEDFRAEFIVEQNFRHMAIFRDDNRKILGPSSLHCFLKFRP